jgi:hypothetical protein
MRRGLPLLLLCPALATAQITVTLDRFVETRTASPETSRLRCELRLAGPGLDDALDFGNPRLTTATDDQGRALAPAPGSPGVFLPLRPIPGAPPQAVATLDLAAPPRSSRALARLAGSLDLRFYRYQIVRIANATESTDTDFKDPLFAAHGFAVRIVHPRHAFPELSGAETEDALRRRAVCLEITGNAAALRGLELRGPDDRPIAARTVSFGTRQFTLWAAAADTPLPPGAQALLRIPIDPETRPVPFDLRDLTLP